MKRRDRDAVEAGFRFQVLMWSPVGLILGALLGVFGNRALGWPPWTIVALAAAAWLVAYAGPLIILHLAGKSAAVLYAPTGSTTPHLPEYSRADALLVRGAYEDAVHLLELAVQEAPQDPRPYLKIARTYRDHLDGLDDAARWFRRVLREVKMASASTLQVRRELIELYVHRMKKPSRAAPELARIADEAEDAEVARWAEEELARIRRGMRRGD
ncbi:MAG: tetratricopeptide repeat protein [Gemmatimonadota bacterium]